MKMFVIAMHVPLSQKILITSSFREKSYFHLLWYEFHALVGIVYNRSENSLNHGSNNSFLGTRLGSNKYYKNYIFIQLKYLLIWAR